MSIGAFIGEEVFFSQYCNGSPNGFRGMLPDIFQKKCLTSEMRRAVSHLIDASMIVFFLSFALVAKLMNPKGWSCNVTFCMTCVGFASVLKGLLHLSTSFPSLTCVPCQGIAFLRKQPFWIAISRHFFSPLTGRYSEVSCPMSFHSSAVTLTLMSFTRLIEVSAEHYIILVMVPTIAWIAILGGCIFLGRNYTSEIFVGIVMGWFCFALLSWLQVLGKREEYQNSKLSDIIFTLYEQEEQQELLADVSTA
jgi:hypothetical protein